MCDYAEDGFYVFRVSKLVFGADFDFLATI